jgi:hypothetical protein
MATLGSYRVLGELGRGAVAQVYLASAQGVPGGGDLVVIKVLRNIPPEHMPTCLDEARAAGRLHHPSVVQSYEARQENGSLFMVTEYLHGPTLLDLRRADVPRVPLAIELDIACNVLDGLHHAHELAGAEGRPASVVHRDLWPGNVMITEHGDTKILDFGVAQAKDCIALTRAGSWRGKLGHLAPEQLRGQTVDRRTDVYAAGLMLCEGLVGRSPWGELGDVEISARLARNEVPPVHDFAAALPKGLRDICARATEARPEKRYASALEFRTVLLAYAQENDLLVPRAKLAAYIEGMFAEGRARIERMLKRRGTTRGRQTRGVPVVAAKTPTPTPVATITVAPPAPAAPSTPGPAVSPEEAIPPAPARETPATSAVARAPTSRRRVTAVAVGLSALAAVAVVAIARQHLAFPPAAEEHAPGALAPGPSPARAAPASPPVPTPTAAAERAEQPGDPLTDPYAAEDDHPVAAGPVAAEPVAAEPVAAASPPSPPTTPVRPTRSKAAGSRPRKPQRARAVIAPAAAASEAPPEQPRRWNGRKLDFESPYPSTGPAAPAAPAERTRRSIDRANPFGGPQ